MLDGYTVTSIEEKAYSIYNSLTRTTISNSIGGCAFMYCNQLILTISRDSYAEVYAINLRIPNTYSDENC